MTRRTWLQRAPASAAFVAGTNFATLMPKPKEKSWFVDTYMSHFRLFAKVFRETVDQGKADQAQAMTNAIYDAMRKQRYSLVT